MTVRRLVSWYVAFVSFVCAAVPLLAQAQEPQTEFVPLRDVPRSEQIPAAPFVFIAYAIVWLAVLFYVWTLWNRQGRVEKELHDLQHRLGQHDRKP